MLGIDAITITVALLGALFGAATFVFGRQWERADAEAKRQLELRKLYDGTHEIHQGLGRLYVIARRPVYRDGVH